MKKNTIKHANGMMRTAFVKGLLINVEAFCFYDISVLFLQFPRICAAENMYCVVSVCVVKWDKHPGSTFSAVSCLKLLTFCFCFFLKA